MTKKFSPKADIFLLFACFIFSGLLSLFLGQDSNWDLRNYHFYNAYALLNNRLLYDVAPAHIQTFLNPIMDVPLYLLITNFPPLVVGFIIGGLQGLNLWLVYKIAYVALTNISEGRRQLLSLAAGITGYLGVANVSEIGTVFGDNLASLFVLAALLVTISSMQKKSDKGLFISKRRLIVSGILLGLGTGLKLTTAIYAIGYLLALLLTGASWKYRVKNVLLAGISIGMGAVATMGYWTATMWRNFNSPFFPFYNKIFKSDYYEFVNFSDSRFFPRDLYEKLFYPFYFVKQQQLVSEIPFRDLRLAICYIFLCLFLFMKLYEVVRKEDRNKNSLDHGGPSQNYKSVLHFILLFSIFSYIVWQNTFSVYRYIIPLELLSPIFIVLIIGYIFPYRQEIIKSSFAVFALLIFTVHPMCWGRVAWSESYFGVEIPAVENLEHSTILLPGYYPVAYVIPYFPAGTRFVSVVNNFIRPNSNTLLQTKIRAIIQKEGSNPLYVMCKENELNKTTIDLLNYYGLSLDEQECNKISSKIDKDLVLCKIEKKSSNSRVSLNKDYWIRPCSAG